VEGEDRALFSVDICPRSYARGSDQTGRVFMDGENQVGVESNPYGIAGNSGAVRIHSDGWS
jgi:hypothetical protein